MDTELDPVMPVNESNFGFEGANEALSACVAYEAVPCKDPVIPAVTTRDPVTVNDPVIKALPVNGKAAPPPPATAKANEDVVAYEALNAVISKPNIFVVAILLYL